MAIKLRDTELYAVIVGTGTVVRTSQLLRALEASGAGRVAALIDEIPADPGDSTHIEFHYSPFTSRTGTIATLIASTFSLDSTAMDSLFLNAAAIGY